MRHIKQVVVLFAALHVLSLPGVAQYRQPGAPHEDKVYSAKEVDQKAVITNRKKLDPERLGPATDCRSGARVVLKAILRKSGKVTDINVTKPASCSLDEKAVKIFSHATFTPARKGGAPVSQYIIIMYEFR